MDTRRKIVQRQSLPARQSNLRLAKGWFDVLTAEHCELLTELKDPNGPLVVLIYSETELRPSPLRAFDRAQMVAALRSVDWVCVCEAPESEEIARSIQPETVLDIEVVQQRDVVRDVRELHAEG